MAPPGGLIDMNSLVGGLAPAHNAQMDPEMDPERVEFEVKTAFLERTVDTLNEVVIEQGRTLEALVRRVAELEGMVKGQTGGTGDGPDPLEERPPHY